MIGTNVVILDSKVFQEHPSAQMVEINTRSLSSEAMRLPVHAASNTNSVLQRFRKVYFAVLAGAALGLVPKVSAQEPMPNIPIAAAEPDEGTLLIAGGGDLPKEITDRFVELAGGKNARIVIIPTASTSADESEQKVSSYWDGDTQSIRSVTLLHTRDREKANSEAFVRPLKDATGVWISGGAQLRLSEAYGNTRTEEELLALLKRNGVVGGTSAGAAIMSPRMIAEGDRVAVPGKGFRLTHPRVVIDQHFFRKKREERLKGFIEADPDLRGIGIAECTALEIRRNMGTVLGAGKIYVCRPGTEPELLLPGQRLNLSELLGASVTMAP